MTALIHTPFGGSVGWQVIGWVANLAWLEFSIWMGVGNFRTVGQVVPLEEAFVGRKVRVSWAIGLKARRKKESLSTQEQVWMGDGV